MGRIHTHKPKGEDAVPDPGMRIRQGMDHQDDSFNRDSKGVLKSEFFISEEESRKGTIRLHTKDQQPIIQQD